MTGLKHIFRRGHLERSRHFRVYLVKLSVAMRSSKNNLRYLCSASLFFPFCILIEIHNSQVLAECPEDLERGWLVEVDAACDFEDEEVEWKSIQAEEKNGASE